MNRNPVYSAFMEDVVNSVAETFDDVELDKRSPQQVAQIEPYKPTIEGLDLTVAPAYASGRKQTKTTAVAEDEESVASSLKSPTFQRQAEDFLGSCSEEVAHLMPQDTGCAVFWGFVAIAVLGQGARSTTLLVQSMIHGSQKHRVVARVVRSIIRRAAKAISRKRKADEIEEEGGQPIETVRLTGLKHCSLNKIQLNEDKLPYMLLVPALDMESILNWTPGTPYTVICMVGEKRPAGKVYTDYRRRFDYCSPADKDDFKTAVTSLAKCVKALGNSHATRTDLAEMFTLAKACDKGFAKTKEEKLRETRRKLLKEKTIIVPQLVEGVDFSSVPSILVERIVPDPYLLLVKAAANWCNYHDQKVLPGCTVDKECECCMCADAAYCAAHPSIPTEIVLGDMDVQSTPDYQ